MVRKKRKSSRFPRIRVRHKKSLGQLIREILYLVICILLTTVTVVLGYWCFTHAHEVEGLVVSGIGAGMFMSTLTIGLLITLPEKINLMDVISDHIGGVESSFPCFFELSDQRYTGIFYVGEQGLLFLIDEGGFVSFTWSAIDAVDIDDSTISIEACNTCVSFSCDHILNLSVIKEKIEEKRHPPRDIELDSWWD